MPEGHHNQDYYNDAGDIIPLAVGDRYYNQDLGRDFWYTLGRIGLLKKQYLSSLPSLISGGVVTKGTGDTLDITIAIGLVEFETTVPDDFSALPPTTTTEDIIVMVESIGQVNLVIGSATLDGVTVNYVKLAYSELDSGATRQRAKKAGTYEYKKLPSYVITVDSTPPTSKELQLNTFTGTGGGAFTFSGSQTSKASIPLVFDNSNDLKKIELKEGQGNEIGTNVNGIVYNVPTGEKHLFHVNSVETAIMDNNSFNLSNGKKLRHNGQNVWGFDISGTPIYRKVITGSMLSGQTTLNLAHGITSAYTNSMIEGFFVEFDEFSVRYYAAVDGAAWHPATYSYDNTNIVLLRGVTTNTIPVRVFIFYKI